MDAAPCKVLRGVCCARDRLYRPLPAPTPMPTSLHREIGFHPAKRRKCVSLVKPDKHLSVELESCAVDAYNSLQANLDVVSSLRSSCTSNLRTGRLSGGDGARHPSNVSLGKCHIPSEEVGAPAFPRCPSKHNHAENTI